MERNIIQREEVVVTYKIGGIGLNIIAYIYVYGVEYIKFNCHTKFEDKAHNIIKKILLDSIEIGLKQSIEKNNCEIVKW